MISKEIFVKTIEELYDLEKKMDAVDEAMRNINRECGFFVPQTLDIIIDLLEEVMEDKDEWISYFIIECDFLDDFHYGDIIINGESIDIKNWEDVYDFIVGMNHE